MGISNLFSGLGGALGLYSTVKGFLDASKAKKEQKKLLQKANAEEEGWYKRNYYGNYFDNSATRAAIKRVERTLNRRGQQDRARGVLIGATPEYAAMRNGQGLQAMENVMTNVASGADDRRRMVDAQHRQNSLSLLNANQQNLTLDERMAASSAMSGFNMLQNALLGAEWGKER